MSFYEKGAVRIHYEEAGSGFPLLLIAGGGLNSTISGLTNPFDAIGEFKGEYRDLLQTAARTGLRVTVCTIHNGNFPDRHTSIVTSTALTPFNDAIIRAAWEHELPIIDLRTICNRPEHYANPIEPSTEGSARIAEAILRTIKRMNHSDPTKGKKE